MSLHLSKILYNIIPSQIKKEESTAKLHSIPKRTVKRGHNITIMVLNSNLKMSISIERGYPVGSL